MHAPNNDPVRFAVFSGMLVFLIAMVFVPGIGDGFYFDDNISIQTNNSIHTLNLLEILKTQTDTPSAGRPLTNLSYAIDYYFYGENAKAYRWTNLILQMLVSISILAVLRRLLPLCFKTGFLTQQKTDWLALGATLLWAVHPVQTECVLYITQRSEQFSMLCMTLAFYALLLDHQSNTSTKRWKILMIASTCIGLLFKQTTAALPIILILADRALLNKTWKDVLKQRGKVHLTCMILSVLIAALILLSDPTPKSTGTGLGVTRWQYLMTQSQVIIWYFRNCFWPTGLCLNYDWPIVNEFSQVIIPFGICTGLVFFSCICIVYRPRLGFALASIFLLLGPTSSLIPIVTEVAADRRISLILLFILLPAIILIGNLCRQSKDKVCLILTWAGVLMFSVMTIELSALHLNHIVLWEHTRKQAIQKQSSWEHLGCQYDSLGQWAPAWQCHSNALKLEPTFNISRMNLGMVNAQLGRTDRDIAQLNHEANTPGIGPDALNILGNIYKKDKDYEQAIKAFRIAYQRAPKRWTFGLNLARVYNLTEQYEKALAILEPLTQQPRVHPDIDSEIGFSYSNLNRLNQAEQSYQRYLLQQPDDAKILNSMGVVQAKLGKLDQALNYFKRAVKADSELEEAKDNLSRAEKMLQAPQD